MVESSKTSVQNVKRVTLGIAERLQIVQQALADLQTAGIGVRVSSFRTNSVIIVLNDVEYVNGNLIAINGIKEQ